MIARLRALLRRGSDDRGVTIIEFAVILPVMLLLLMGIVELTYQAYVRSTLQGALNKAGRDSTLENAAADADQIDGKVIAMVRQIAPSATFQTTRMSYASFSDVGKPEAFNDANGNGVRDSDECFEDVNGNGSWDTDRGKQGLGGADDIVSYTTTATYPTLFPFMVAAGFPELQQVTATTVLRNQPFGQQQVSSKVICP